MPTRQRFTKVKKLIPQPIQHILVVMLLTFHKSRPNLSPEKISRLTRSLSIVIRNMFLKKPSLAAMTAYRKNIKIYDAFLFFNELELLKLRLHILDKYVDFFVIIESTETFTGIAKPLVFDEHKEDFKEFKDRIIHYVVRNTPKSVDDIRQRLLDSQLSPLEKEILSVTLTTDSIPQDQTQWLKEFYQKEAIKYALTGLSDNDVVYISDIDEIWNPEIPIDYSRDDLYKYKQTAYYYYLNNRSNDDWRNWNGTIVTKYKNIRRGCINHLRNANKNIYTVIKNGGWHFTFQGGVERIKQKLESYGHQEFNTTEVKSQLEDVLSQNRDYRGRNLKFWTDESQLPKYLLKHREEYTRLFKPNT